MGVITSWLEDLHRHGLREMTPCELEAFVRSAYQGVQAALRAKFPNSRMFGGDIGDDLAQEVMVWLLVVARGERPHGTPEEPFPKRVQDTISLVTFLVDKACKRAYDRYHRRVDTIDGMPRERGGSALAGRRDGIEVTPQTFGEIDTTSRRGSPAFDPFDAKITIDDDLVATIDDLRVLCDSDARPLRVFELHFLDGHSIDDIAGKLNLATGTIRRDLKMFEFCLMRRQGKDIAILADECPNAEKWDSTLKAHGR